MSADSIATPDELRLTVDDYSVAATIADSPTVIGQYAVPEWDELDDDGKTWVAAIVRAARAFNVPPGSPRYRHVKRGTVYEVIGEASLQIATNDLVDGDHLIIYRGKDGKLWAREEGEFHDGRFVVTD